MPWELTPQPEIITIRKDLRLRKYDGNYMLMLPGYQDPYVYQNSEGIFDDSKKPDLDYVKGMCDFLDRAGELYFIETLETGGFRSIGDVTVKEENPPIAIWYPEYRQIGIGTQVMRAVIGRARQLGFSRITGSEVFRWNLPSQRMHEKLGFRRVGETRDSFLYELSFPDLPDENA